MASNTENDANNIKNYFQECKQVLEQFSTSHMNYQKQSEKLQAEMEVLKGQNKDLIRSNEELKKYISDKIQLDCRELSAVARSEELDRELSKLKEHMQLVAKKDEQEKREALDRERERYEQVLNSVTESYEERIHQLKQDLEKAATDHESEAKTLKNQVAKKEQELKATTEQKDCMRTELEEKLVEERVQAESELQSHIASLQNQIEQLSRQQQLIKASAYSWNAPQEQMHRKKIAEMKSDHEKQIRNLQLKLKQLEAKMRRCTCASDNQTSTTIRRDGARFPTVNSFSSASSTSDHRNMHF